MNILFEDWDGSQMPRSKLKNSGGVVAERYAGPTRAQDRLLGEMDRGMSLVVEKRLNELLERSNHRESKAGRPTSSLVKPAAEMASEKKDFDGYVQCIPVAAEGLKDSTVGSMMGIPQAPFVTVSLVHDSAADANISVSSPTDLAGHIRPRWRRKPCENEQGYCSKLCLPLYTKLRPIQRLRIEVQAMDRAFGHTLLGATELSFVAQPSTATFLRLPLTLPSSSYSISYMDSMGLQGLGTEVYGFIDVEIQVIAESGTRAGNAEQTMSDFCSPLIWECLSSDLPNQPPISWQDESGAAKASNISDFLILEPKGGAWVTSVGLSPNCSTLRNQRRASLPPNGSNSFSALAGSTATSMRESMAAAYVAVAGTASDKDDISQSKEEKETGGIGGVGIRDEKNGEDSEFSDEFSPPPPTKPSTWSPSIRRKERHPENVPNFSEQMNGLD